MWDPHQIQQIQRLEQVQRQAARLATGNYYSRDPGCVTNMLKDLQWEPLQHRRVREQPFDFYGGGAGAGRLKWAGEFFLPIFRAGEFFSPSLRAGLFF